MSVKGIEIRPDQVGAEFVARAERRIRDYLASNPDAESVEVIPEVGSREPLPVPRAVVIMLGQIFAMLSEGQVVQIIPDRAMLTTQQAADMLNVSRPYLIGLLEDGKIDFEMVGTHRRIPFAALREYQQSESRRRRAIADDLTRLGEELGGD